MAQRRFSLPLVLGLLAAPLALSTPVALAAPAQEAKVNRSMSKALPDDPDGWEMGEIRPARGALPMYSVATAEAVYKKGNVEVTVGAARSPTLFKAVMGSVKNTGTLPPDSKVEVIADHYAIVARFPNSTPPLYTIQLLAGTDGIVMLTTRNGTYEHLVELAKQVDFDHFPLR
ncbi:hypothetical protein [Niveispirillum sp. BGYR6]|uniref:hypothetical protein n=1 Tax=Niveispirillum sp. BGYR6 TaxID=2971249 RepID=UPI0022B9934E|nr:hypothetical protein [Niveispirillum sp. BGYR6]MDG5495295.1 hypothetical protein [Niveispirillum sp. BGYR6]